MLKNNCTKWVWAWFLSFDDQLLFWFGNFMTISCNVCHYQWSVKAFPLWCNYVRFWIDFTCPFVTDREHFSTLSYRRCWNLHRRRRESRLPFHWVNWPMTTRQRANVDQWRRSAMNANESRALTDLWWMAVKRQQIVTKIATSSV